MGLEERFIDRINQHQVSMMWNSKVDEDTKRRSMMELQGELEGILIEEVRKPSVDKNQIINSFFIMTSYGVTYEIQKIKNQLDFHNYETEVVKYQISPSVEVEFQQASFFREEDFQHLWLEGKEILEAIEDEKLKKYLKCLQPAIGRYLIYTELGEFPQESLYYAEFRPLAQYLYQYNHYKKLSEENRKILAEATELNPQWDLAYMLMASNLSLRLIALFDLEDHMVSNEKTQEILGGLREKQKDLLKEFFRVFDKISDTSKDFLIFGIRDRQFFKFPLGQDIYSIEKLVNRLSNEEEKLKKLREKKEVMMDDFAHFWTNVVKPQVIYEVAQSISNKKEFKQEYKALVRVYNDEIMMKNECEILKSFHSNRIIELKGLIRGGKLEGGDFGIKEMIDYSLARVLFMLLYEESQRGEGIREKIIKKGKSFEDFIDSYNKEIIINDRDIRQWIHRHLCDIHIDIQGSWPDILFNKNSIGATFLLRRFMELWLVALQFHSQPHCPITVDLRDEEIDYDEFLLISLRIPVGEVASKNHIDKASDILMGANKLLNAVNFFHVASHEEQDSITIEMDSNTVSCDMLILKDLLI